MVASRIELRITVPSTVNIPFDPFETEPGNSFPDMMNVEHKLQPVTGILSIDDQLGYNVPNNLKIQIVNDQKVYVNLGKLLINNPDPKDDA